MQMSSGDFLLLFAILGVLFYFLFVSGKISRKYSSEKKRYSSINGIDFQPSKIVLDSEVPFLALMVVCDRLLIDGGAEWATLEFTKTGSHGGVKIKQDFLMFSGRRFPYSLQKSRFLQTVDGSHLGFSEENLTIPSRFHKYSWYCDRISVVSGRWGICFIKSGDPFRADQVDQIVRDVGYEISILNLQ